MSQQAKLSTYPLDYGLQDLILGKPEDGCWIKCETTYPPSSKGRKVYVHVEAGQVAELMKNLRDEAIRQRMKAMKP